LNATGVNENSVMSKKWVNLAAVLLGIFIFIIYFITLYPGVPGGDSGELIPVRTLFQSCIRPGILFLFYSVNYSHSSLSIQLHGG